VYRKGREVRVDLLGYLLVTGIGQDTGIACQTEISRHNKQRDSAAVIYSVHSERRGLSL